MAGYQQQRSCRYPNLRVTVKHETEERSVTEIYSNPKTRHSKNNSRPTYFHPTTIYYNSNQRQKQHFTRPSPPKVQHRSQNYDRFYQQPIRPLMEIEDNYSDFEQKQPKQRGQYRNRKAELDWDHAFDLDQVDLYTTQNDIDNHSLSSLNSLSENSFSSV
jgi:hypothetical protein